MNEFEVWKLILMLIPLFLTLFLGLNLGELKI